MTRHLWAAIAFTVLAFGCATTIPPPSGPEPASPAEALAAWSRVLQKNVDDRGRIDFGTIAKDPEDLRLFLRYVATNSPESKPAEFRTPAERLAYFLNSYNALAMYGIIETGQPEYLSGGARLGFFVLRDLDVGGHYLSLYRYENDVIRPEGDERVHFALNCMVRGCPVLPREPFAAERLESQLDAQARRFMNEERNVQIQAERHTVRVSSILSFYTRDFLAKSPTLIHYINRYRIGKVPEDYQVEFNPYDWTVNAQPGSARAAMSETNRFQIASGSKSLTH